MTTYGYGRVSREEQTVENQKQVIELQQKIHVDKWFEDQGVSGKIRAMERQEFSSMMKSAVRGDTIVFTRVDRIGRRAADILTVVEEILELGIEVYILQIGEVALSSSVGKMMLGILAIFAENDRLSIIERTKDGMARTARQGTKMGAPLKITPEQLNVMFMARDAGATFSEIAAKHKLPRNTVQRNMEKWEGNFKGYKEEYEARQAQYKVKAA